jgi:hypothetical protein
LFFSPHAVHGRRHRSSALRRQHAHRQAESPNIENGLNSAIQNLGLGKYLAHSFFSFAD